MKIEKQEVKFTPITITLETQEEVDQMFALANCTSFYDTKNKIGDITSTLYGKLNQSFGVSYSMDKSGMFTLD